MTLSLGTLSGLAPRRATRVVIEEVAVSPIVLATMLLFVASIPFESPTRTIPLEVPTLTGFIFLACTLLNPSRCYRGIPAPMLAFAAYLWALLVVSVLAGMPNRDLVTRFAIAMVQLVWLFWVLVNLFEDPRLLRAALLTLVVACAVRAAFQLLGILTAGHTVWTGGARVTTLGQNPNLSAIILSAGLVAAVGLARSQLSPPRWLRLLVIPLGVAFCAAVIQSGSRGGLLCAALGLSVFTLHGATVAARVRNVLLGVAGIVALGVGAWRSDMMRHRLEESATEGRLAGRELIYPAAVGMIRERPLLGWGPIENQFEIARRIRERELPRRDAHNLVLELATSSGMLGLLPFLLGLALVARSALRARHGAAGLLPVALLAAVLTGTISGTWIAAKVLWLALAVGAAAGHASYFAPGEGVS